MSITQTGDKKKILKILFIFLELSTTKLAKTLNVSNSVISKHISGEKNYCPCDIYLIEQIFNIKVLEYRKICR